jgi:hypothetical protein
MFSPLKKRRSGTPPISSDLESKLAVDRHRRGVKFDPHTHSPQPPKPSLQP